MAKKKEEGAKPRKMRKTRKTAKSARASTRRAAKPDEEVIEPEDIEEVEDETFDDNDDVEAEIEIEIDDDEDDPRDEWRRRRRQFKREFKREFNAENIFGPDGPFGPGGPFGSGSPFGPGGIFGPGGMFAKSNRRGKHRHRGARFAAGGQRRERMFGPGELRLVLLAMLAEEPRHGYELIKALEEMTGGAYSPSPGIIYPTLQMLADEGAIAEQDSEDARKLYQATESGLAELEERTDEIEELWERLGRKAEKARPAAGSSDIFRALGNLATVLTNKASGGGLKNVEKEQIVDLIDALSRKIERL